MFEKIGDRMAKKALESSAFQQSLQAHRKAFGPVFEPAFANNASARVHLVNALNKISRRDITGGYSLLEKLEDACKTDADSEALLFFKGLAHEAAGDMDEAVRFYLEFTEHNNGYYLPYLKAARYAHKTSNLERAAQAYQEAIRCLEKDTSGSQDPEILASAYTHYAACLVLAHRYDPAAEMLKKSREALSESTERIVVEAMLHAASGDARQALALAEEAGKTSPEYKNRTVQLVRSILDGTHPCFKKDGKILKTPNDAQALLADYGLQARSEQILSQLKRSIRMELASQEDGDLPVGVSKMGGLPDLPRGVDWFRRDSTGVCLSFVCQINFAEVQACSAEGKLPDRGILYFFYDCSMDGMPWGFDPEDADGKVLYYYDGELSNLARKEAPEDLERDGSVFTSAKIRFEEALDLPDLDSPAGEAIDLSEDEVDAYIEMLDELTEAGGNKLLGHADIIQSAMEPECEMVTGRLNRGNSRSRRTDPGEDLDERASRWSLLLQVESNEELGMMWGDCGRLYLWIPEDDLAAKNFDASWLILQCT